MPIVPPTEQAIQRLVQPQLQRIEAHRIESLQAVERAKKWAFVPLTSFAAGLVLLWQNRVPLLAMGTMGLSVVGGWIGYLAWVRPAARRFDQTYHTQAQKLLLERLAPNWDYQPEKWVSKNYWRAASLYGACNRYKGRHYLGGHTRKGHAFCASQLEVGRLIKGEYGQYTKPIFNGWLVAMKLPTAADRWVQLLPSSTSVDLEQVELISRAGHQSSSAFQGTPRMQAYGDKRFAAANRAVLTVPLLEFVDELLDHYREGGPRVAILNDHLYCAVPIRAQLFRSPGLDEPVTRPAYVQAVYRDFSFVWTLIEGLSAAVAAKPASTP